MTVFRNGALIEPEDYTVVGSALTINVPVYAGDNIDIPSKAILEGNLNIVDPSVYTSVTTVAGNTYAATISNQVILLAAQDFIAVTLPQTSANTVVKTIVFKDILGSGRAGLPASIIAHATNTIDGNVSFQIARPYNSVTLLCTSSTSWGVI
jgi:hypothetical protein